MEAEKTSARPTHLKLITALGISSVALLVKAMLHDYEISSMQKNELKLYKLVTDVVSNETISASNQRKMFELIRELEQKHDQ